MCGDRASAGRLSAMPQEQMTTPRHIPKMFETRSHAWRQAGLIRQLSPAVVRRARLEALVFLPAFIAIVFVHDHRKSLLGISDGSTWDTPERIITVIALLILGWWIARDIGRALGPGLFRRMDPATAGTVGFLMRLATVGIALLIALGTAGVDPRTLAVGGAFTAVIIGLAAQQTLGNVIAGLVLLSAHPFRVGDRVRIQAGALGGAQEGVVSSLGLLYTTLAAGEDAIMLPNSAVLSAAVTPLREPDSVDLRARLRPGVTPGDLQSLLEEKLETPLRDSPSIILEELDGDEVVVRINATPKIAADGPRLATEVLKIVSQETRSSDNGDDDDRVDDDGRARAGSETGRDSVGAPVGSVRTPPSPVSGPVRPAPPQSPRAPR